MVFQALKFDAPSNACLGLIDEAIIAKKLVTDPIAEYVSSMGNLNVLFSPKL